jgi:hypothetical protein
LACANKTIQVSNKNNKACNVLENRWKYCQYMPIARTRPKPIKRMANKTSFVHGLFAIWARQKAENYMVLKLVSALAGAALGLFFRLPGNSFTCCDSDSCADGWRVYERK